MLKPAAVRARVGIFAQQSGKGEAVESTDVNFQVLRRTCATLFGAKAKDPRDTQSHLRHADPTVTLRHYQKSIPASVRAAAVALEEELIGSSANHSEQVLNRSGFDDALEVLENYGATRRGRTGDLLITKNIPRFQTLHSLHTDVPDINNLGKLLSIKQQLRAPQRYGVLAQFPHRWTSSQNNFGRVHCSEPTNKSYRTDDLL